MRKGKAETTSRKRKKKKLEKIGTLVLKPLLSFQKVASPVPQSRENEKMFDVFLPNLFMYLVHTIASNHQIHPASLLYFAGSQGLSVAVSSKGSAGNRMAVTRQQAGMVGGRGAGDGSCLMDCWQTPEQKEANKSALLAPFCAGILK